MKTNWKSRLRRMSLSAPLLFVLIATASTALAAAWKSASWGRARIELDGFGDQGVSYTTIWGDTDDILEDGYCVYLRYRKPGGSWPGTTVPNSKSCGPIKHVLYDVRGSVAGVRLYREDGRYLTMLGS